MHKQIARTLVVATALAAAGAAIAEPKNGFGLNGGLASHGSDITFDPSAGGGTAKGTSSGLSIGIDYQFAINPSFSVNPFLMSSGESSGGDWASDAKLGHGILGLQLRYWVGNVFIGGHVGSYSEVVSVNGTSTSANGAGVGAVVGWEDPAGGLYLMGQIDSAKLDYSDAEVDLTGVRLSIGYRWK